MDEIKHRAILDGLNRAIRHLYGLEGCAAGGPLHITIEDGNVRDCDLGFCWLVAIGVENGPWGNPEVRWASERVLMYLWQLTEDQREAWYLGNGIVATTIQGSEEG